MNIFEALRKDHDAMREKLDALLNTHGASEEREQLFREIKRELQSHEVAEERHFYVPLFNDDKTQDSVRHSVAEHDEAEELLSKLEEKDLSSSGWLAEAKKLDERVRHHMKEEEEEVFKKAKKALSDDDLRSLADAYLQEMEVQRQKRH